MDTLITLVLLVGLTRAIHIVYWFTKGARAIQVYAGFQKLSKTEIKKLFDELVVPSMFRADFWKLHIHPTEFYGSKIKRLLE